MDMLSAKKVRQHGICDERWTARDKMVQYKGLVRLFQRDSKIITGDTQQLVKRHQDEISNLSNMIKEKKAELKKFMFARKMKLESVLIPYKGIRLICSNLPAEEIVEQVKQIVFNQRKRLDIIRCNRDKKQKKLWALKICILDLQELVNKEFSTKSMKVTAKECEKITGRIQETNLLLQAAISVSNVYKIVMDLLHKDSLYYTQVLYALYGDKFRQNRCILDAILLGQIALEHLDDMKIDFKELHVATAKAHKKRNEDFLKAESVLKNIPKTIKSLVKHDDEKDLSLIVENCEELQNTRLQLEELLTTLKMSIMVSNFEDILPDLVEQENLNKKLQNLVETMKESWNKLSKKVAYEKVTLDVVSHSEYEDTQRYLDRKEELENQINALKLQAERYRLDEEYHTKILADMKVSIVNMKMFCEVINDSEMVELSRSTSNDLLDYLFYIQYKIKCMMTSLIYPEAESTDLKNKCDEYTEFTRTSFQIQIIEAEDKEDEDFSVDNTVLSYLHIKEQSRQIVELYKSHII